jgi:hypothetical protein
MVVVETSRTYFSVPACLLPKVTMRHLASWCGMLTLFRVSLSQVPRIQRIAPCVVVTGAKALRSFDSLDPLPLDTVVSLCPVALPLSEYYLSLVRWPFDARLHVPRRVGVLGAILLSVEPNLTDILEHDDSNADVLEHDVSDADIL